MDTPIGGSRWADDEWLRDEPLACHTERAAEVLGLTNARVRLKNSEQKASYGTNGQHAQPCPRNDKAPTGEGRGYVDG